MRSMCMGVDVFYDSSGHDSDAVQASVVMIEAATIDIVDEALRASVRFPPMTSAHEGYAILLEEVDELWDIVKVKQGSRDLAKMRKEAVQVAAMALRFIVDVCDGGRGQK